jgi:dolichyl-diphosphooligosaccharide--protein glycosyltransferase
MSNWREQLAEEGETRAMVDWLLEYYHYPVMLSLFVFALWNRLRNYENFIVGGDVLYSGNDPWYHARSTQYAIQNFPETMPFDPWTFFPEGTSTGQFGTLFDQLIALVALIVGLGDPSAHTSQVIILVAPAFFGALVAVPAYFIGRRLGGRFGGIVAAMFVAFTPDRLLSVSLAGSTQHEVAEALFMGLAVLGVMVALSAAERDLPVYELLVEGEHDALRAPIGWAMLAGVAIGLYLWVWPPGVFLYGILGVFFVIHLSFEHVRGRSPEHAAFVGSIAFATAGIMQLAGVRTLGINATQRSLLQPAMGLGLALGLVVLAWLSREVDRREVSPLTYPAAIVAAIGVTAGLALLLTPTIFGFFVDQVNRVLGFVTAPGTAEGTIGEAQRGDLQEDIVDVYRFASFTALLGGLVVFIKQVFDDQPEGQQLLMVVWAAFIVAATLTQIRFGYYLTLPIGALNAALVGMVIRLAGTPDRNSLPEAYQVLTVLVIVFVMFVPMFSLPLVGGGETAMSYADNRSQPGGITGWDDSLDWMANNTPEPGQYANPDGEAMEYYGQYKRTDNYDYPNGSYGVLSWWDYGHWITGEGERIPAANPFQQNVRPAADFLLAQNESGAMDILERDFDDHENAKTRYVMIDELMAETDTRVGGKFFAPADFHDDYNRSDFYRTLVSGGGVSGTVQTQNYYQSMLTRLYSYHGSSQAPQPMVVNWQGQVQVSDRGSGFISAPQNTTAEPVVQFAENMSAARDIVANDPSSQIGGLGPYPAERVPALEHFRLVHLDEVALSTLVPAGIPLGGNRTATQQAIDNGLSPGTVSSTIQQTMPLLPNGTGVDRIPYEGDGQKFRFLHDTTPSYTKTFERVPGATIDGTIDENASLDEIRLSVQMNPANGRNFTYTQQVPVEDNEFTATVPYATTGGDEFGVAEGYTNTSVQATGPYRIQAFGGVEEGENGTQVLVRYRGTANVTEGQVLGENETSATVFVEEFRQELNFGSGGNGGSGDGSGDESGDGSGDGSGDESGSDESGDGSSDGSTDGGSGNGGGTDSGGDSTSGSSGAETN